MDRSVPRDAKGTKIHLSAVLGFFFFCFHLHYWNGDAYLFGRLCVLRALGTLCQKYWQYWAVNPQGLVPLWLGWASRKQRRAMSEHRLPFVRFSESSVFSWNVSLCWLSSLTDWWWNWKFTAQSSYHHLIPSKAFEESASLPCGVSGGQAKQFLSLLAVAQS